MSNTFRSKGETMPYLAGADFAINEVVIMDNLVGIAQEAIANGAVGTIEVTGVHELTVETPTETWEQGALLYVEGTAKTLTATTTGNHFAGIAWDKKLAAATTAKVKLNQYSLS